MHAADATDLHAVDLIRAKRDGERLADAEIDWLIDAYVRGAPSPTSRCRRC